MLPHAFTTIVLCCLSVFLSRVQGADTISLGSIKVLAQQKCILIPAHTVLDSGILEYVAVTPGGKTYESIMALDCDPTHLHAALLLLNAKPGQIVQGKPMDESYATGGILELTVLYTIDGKMKELPLLELLAYRDSTLAKKQALLKKNLKWVFTGSLQINVDGQGHLMNESAISGSLISVIQDQAAEINLSQPAGIPYRGPYLGFEVNRKVVDSIGKTYLLQIRYSGTFFKGPEK